MAACIRRGIAGASEPVHLRNEKPSRFYIFGRDRLRYCFKSGEV